MRWGGSCLLAHWNAHNALSIYVYAYEYAYHKGKTLMAEEDEERLMRLGALASAMERSNSCASWR